MKSKSYIRVEGNTYKSEFEILSDDLLLFEREHVRELGTSEIDAFTSMWSLAFAKVDPAQVAVKRRGQVIERSGWWAAFFPPFSLVEWRLAPGCLVWSAFLSTSPVPEGLPKKATAFRWNPNWNPKSSEEIFSIVEQADETVLINKEEILTPVAIKAKELIEATFSDHEVSVAEIAKTIGVSHSFLARSFRKAFGLTPVAFRNKLRVFESLKLMLVSGHNVTVASHEVGFGDMARFNKQFRSQMNAVPSQFCFEKKNLESR